MQIADWLVTHNEDDFMNVNYNHQSKIHTINQPCHLFILQVYARFRANSVQKTLLGLRDHLRNSSTGATSHQGVSPVAPMSGTATLLVI